MTWLRKLDAALAWTMRTVVIACLIGILILMIVGIVVREVPVVSIAGYDEIIEFLFAWMVFIGAAALWRQQSHFRVGALLDMAPARVRFALDLLSLIAGLVLAFVLIYWGWLFAAGSIEHTPFLQLPKSGWYYSVPAGGVLIAVYAVAEIVQLLSRRTGPRGDTDV